MKAGKSSSQGAFFKAETRLKRLKNVTALLSASHARLGGYNIWETLESFSRLGRFLNESPAAASPSNCNMCLHTVILKEMMAFTLMTWSSRTAYCSREKPSFFTVIWVFLFLFFFFPSLFFFFSQRNFILRNRHRRLNVLYRLSKYERGFGTWNRYIDNVPPRAVIIVLIMLHLNFSFFFFFIFLGDYAKQNIVLIIADTRAALFHSSYEAISPPMINTTSPLNSQCTFPLLSLLF